MPNLIRNSFILARAEGSTPGVDAIAAQAAQDRPANAIRVISMDVNPIAGDRVQRQNMQGFLGARKSMLARDHVGITITLELGGSGTVGTAPRYASLLGACGLGGSVLSTAQAGACTAATAGGAGVNPTITLAATASTTVDAYVGMHIRLTSGANSGKTGIIVAYTAARVATVYTNTGFSATVGDTYEIVQNQQYLPISTFDGQSNTTATIYAVKGNNLHIITGFRGNPQISGDLNGYPTLTITGVGKFNTVSASTGVTASFGGQAEPAMFEFDSVGPVSFINYNSPCLSAFSVDYGNNVVFRNLVNCSEQVLITDRAVTGSITMEMPDVATKDYFAVARDNTGASDGQFILQHGLTAGNRVIIYARRTGINGDISFSDMDGVEMMQIPTVMYPSSAGNDEIMLTFC